MSKYDRIDPRSAAEPVKHMRIYGRTSGGRLAVCVVHEVYEGRVYFARRCRREEPVLYWTSCETWRSNVIETIDRGLIIGVQVPRAEATSHA